MTKSRSTPKVNFTKIPDNNEVSYEEIRALLWRRHKNDHIGDNDTM